MSDTVHTLYVQCTWIAIPNLEHNCGQKRRLEMPISYLVNICKVGENIIGAPKNTEMLNYPIIGLFSFAPHLVIALLTLR